MFSTNGKEDVMKLFFWERRNCEKPLSTTALLVIAKSDIEAMKIIQRFFKNSEGEDSNFSNVDSDHSKHNAIPTIRQELCRLLDLQEKPVKKGRTLRKNVEGHKRRSWPSEVLKGVTILWA